MAVPRCIGDFPKHFEGTRGQEFQRHAGTCRGLPNQETAIRDFCIFNVQFHGRSDGGWERLLEGSVI